MSEILKQNYTSIKNDYTIDGTNTDWRSGLGYMRVAEAQALLTSRQATNVYGNNMKIVVCGAGRVGISISEHLSTENNDITVVDSNSEALKKITELYAWNKIINMI